MAKSTSMSSRKLLVLSAVATAALMSVGAAQAADAATDFSLASNPNGAWSYGYALALNGSFTAFASAGTLNGGPGETLDRWSDGADLGIGKAGATGWTCCSSVQIPANTLNLHPGIGNEFAVLRYTVPVAGLYQLSAVFRGNDDKGPQGNGPGTSTDVHVMVGGTGLFSGAVTGFGAPSTQSYATPFALLAGDTVNFIVGTGGNGHGYDSTGLVASVTAVPEPGAAALLLAGLAVVAAAARKRDAS